MAKTGYSSMTYTGPITDIWLTISINAMTASRIAGNTRVLNNAAPMSQGLQVDTLAS